MPDPAVHWLSTLDLARLNDSLKLHEKWPEFETDTEKFRFLISALAGEELEEELLGCFLGLIACGKLASIANTMKKEWRGDFGNTGDDLPREWVEKIKGEMNDAGNYLFMSAGLLNHNLLRGMLDKLLEVEQRPEYQRAIREYYERHPTKE